MTRTPNDLIAEWLDAEGRGDPDEADRRLHLAVHRLDRLAPLPGFAGRVLVAVGVVRPRASVFHFRWARIATTAAIALAGLGILGLPLAWLLVEAPSAGTRLVTGVVALGVWAAHVGKALFAVFTLTVQVGQAVQLAATTPPALAAFAGSLSVAALSLAALGRLLAPRQGLIQC